MLAIIGLGNPGKKYELTRHNVGFMFLDYLADCNGQTFGSSKWDALTVLFHLWGTRVVLAKPQTYMNRSGKSVASITRFYDIAEHRLVVIHDDIDMPLGRIKLANGGGSGGHNGIRSIMQHLGTGDFLRLKIGIGRPGSDGVHADIPVDRYVLSRFHPHEHETLEARFKDVETGLAYLGGGDTARAQTELNRLR